MPDLISVIHKSIHVYHDGNGRYSVAVFVNGAKDAFYGSGTLAWAKRLAEALAQNDDARKVSHTDPEPRLPD
jgi:hypothetical protein